MSIAVLANDDIRKEIRRLRLQFFSDNVTIDSVQEDASQQIDFQKDETSGKEFRAYKWKVMLEGYQVVYEEENTEFGYYVIDFEKENDDFIYYTQNDASTFTTPITYADKRDYKRKIDLNGLEAYSISDGRRNTIFYENNG